MLRLILIITIFCNYSSLATQVRSLENLQHKYYSNIEEHVRKKLKVENLSDKNKYLIYNHAVNSLVQYNFLGFAKNYLQQILKLKTKVNYTQHYIYLLQIYDNEGDRVLLNHTVEEFKNYVSIHGTNAQAKSYINYYSLLKSESLSSELYTRPQRLAIVKLGKTKDVQIHNIKVHIMRKNYNEIYGYLQSIKKNDMTFKLSHIYSSILLNKKSSYACEGKQRGIILKRSCELLKQIRSLTDYQANDKVTNLIGLIESVSTIYNRNEIHLLNEILKQREI